MKDEDKEKRCEDDKVFLHEHMTVSLVPKWDNVKTKEEMVSIKKESAV